jgi:hypothetical protein
LSDHTLNDEESEAAFTVTKQLVTEWNLGHRASIDEMGLIVLDRQSTTYEELRRFFLARVTDNNISPKWLHWSENVECVYSEAELTACGVLELWISGDAGLGGNTYAKVYDVGTCQYCGLLTVHRQLRNLVTDLTKVRSDLASTQDYSETLVSERLHQAIEDASLTGAVFRPVEHARPSRPARRKYFQLTTPNVLEPLLAPRKVWTKRCPGCGRGTDAQEEGIERPDPWTTIDYQRNPGPWSELHFPRSSYQGWDLMCTAETYGGPISPSEPSPLFPRLLISQLLYQLLRQHKITGYWVHPARLD